MVDNTSMTDTTDRPVDDDPEFASDLATAQAHDDDLPEPTDPSLIEPDQGDAGRAGVHGGGE